MLADTLGVLPHVILYFYDPIGFAPSLSSETHQGQAKVWKFLY